MSKKVLVVEDEVDFLKAIEIRLEHAGFEIMTALDGVEAQKLLDNETPDLILLDIQMPKMSGLDLIKEIKKVKHLESIPVIFYTAGAFDIAEEFETLAAGNDFMLKSVDDDQLVDRINALLAS